MSRLFLATLALLALTMTPESTDAAHAKIGAGCSFGGKKLYGKVKFVSAFPDFKVKVVSSFPDLKVKQVEAFPDTCGKWQAVESFPDFTVQIVDSFPDFTIQYVEAFPGVR